MKRLNKKLNMFEEDDPIKIIRLPKIRGLFITR